jgi:hypothetical protein
MAYTKAVRYIAVYSIAREVIRLWSIAPRLSLNEDTIMCSVEEVDAVRKSFEDN